MDEELRELERELRQLRPVSPSPRLLAAVERDLAIPAVKRAFPLETMWEKALPIGAAAAVIFLSALQSDTAPVRSMMRVDGAQAAVLRPVAVENVLVAAEDEGLVTLADGTPARRARLQFLDTITWRNPATDASLRWTVPREEVRVVPVHFQ